MNSLSWRTSTARLASSTELIVTKPKPFDFSVPMEENQAWPFSMMLGTDAIDSTLLMTVGLA